MQLVWRDVTATGGPATYPTKGIATRFEAGDKYGLYYIIPYKGNCNARPVAAPEEQAQWTTYPTKGIATPQASPPKDRHALYPYPTKGIATFLRTTVQFPIRTSYPTKGIATRSDYERHSYCIRVYIPYKGNCNVGGGSG